MRNYMTTHRCDDSFSSLYAAHEDTFISIGQGKGNGELSETIYRLDKKEKALMDSFMYVRNNGIYRGFVHETLINRVAIIKYA